MSGRRRGFLMRSILFKSKKVFGPYFLINSTANWSPWPNETEASTMSRARSKSPSAWRTDCIICSLSRERGLWIPGVSIRTICASARWTTPRMRLRVVWGTGVTMETFVPTRRLSSALLPALGRPTRATKPHLSFSALGMGGGRPSSRVRGIGVFYVGRFRGQGHPDLQDRPLVRVEDFKGHAVFLRLLTFRRHVAEHGKHQASHG